MDVQKEDLQSTADGHETSNSETAKEDKNAECIIGQGTVWIVLTVRNGLVVYRVRHRHMQSALQST